MNNTLNATWMQLPSGTHFHKDKQKCLLLPQSGKFRMDANGPLAKNCRKLNLYAKETSTWTAVHFLLPGSKPGNLKPGESQPVLPSASLTSRCVSAGRFTAPSLAPPSLPCYLHRAWSYVFWSNNGFSEGSVKLAESLLLLVLVSQALLCFLFHVGAGSDRKNTQLP